MKHLFIIIAIIIAYLLCIICPIWIVVEFILYLAKDRPFNWDSVYCEILSILFFISIFIFKGVQVVRDEKKIDAFTFEDRVNYIPKTSKFKDKLNEMESQRLNKNN